MWGYKNFLFHQKAIRLKWVFKVKYHLDGLVAKFKVQLVAQGFSQIPGINFAKIFTFTVRIKLLKI